MVNETLTIINNTRIATLDPRFLSDPNIAHLITYLMTQFPEIPSIILFGAGISCYIATGEDEMKTLILEFLMMFVFISILEIPLDVMASTPTALTLFGLNSIFIIFIFAKFLFCFTDTEQ
ncbi:hypothetical protein MMJJ_02270 [Methanococcus maripaludis]|uniref:Uncharacterized protein n=1 Tax=Methanococcus maripaludis TaxID=39152 RepID=A0A2L1C9T4_METMI|nr:hypothetical protein MMJJ_02270 [Methanococcus maripaludis]